jgi:hypothetical protein
LATGRLTGSSYIAREAPGRASIAKPVTEEEASSNTSKTASGIHEKVPPIRTLNSLQTREGAGSPTIRSQLQRQSLERANLRCQVAVNCRGRGSQADNGATHEEGRRL